MSLEAIGLTSLFGLPWFLKFLWAPAIDGHASKRQWLLVMQGLLVLLFFAAAPLAGLENGTIILALLFFVASFIAATHDVAIDGYYMEALDSLGQAKFVGYRAMAYRIAMMTGTGVVVTVGATRGWPEAFLGSAILLACLFFFHLTCLPSCEEKKDFARNLPRRTLTTIFLAASGLIFAMAALTVFLPRQYEIHGLLTLPDFLNKIHLAGWIGMFLLLTLAIFSLLGRKIKAWAQRKRNIFLGRAIFSFMERERIGQILAFIILIRTGEYMLSLMSAPFMVDLGIKAHYGWISGGMGLPSSILGAMLGGWLIAKHSLKKMIWPFLLAQNATNLTYMVLAFSMQDFLAANTGNQHPVAIGTVNLCLVALVNAFDQFAGGLGTAVLMTYLMRLCTPEFKAAHYAIGTGLMSVSGLFSGALSGYLASWLGYGYFFGMSFLLSLPGMLMIFFVPLYDPQKKAPRNSAAPYA
ncbi:MFS transporter [Thiovibrio sp. JS02]